MAIKSSHTPGCAKVLGKNTYCTKPEGHDGQCCMEWFVKEPKPIMYPIFLCYKTSDGRLDNAWFVGPIELVRWLKVFVALKLVHEIVVVREDEPSLWKY
jgi:hypothetical protein